MRRGFPTADGLPTADTSPRGVDRPKTSRDQRRAWLLAAAAFMTICIVVVVPLSGRYDLWLMLLPPSAKRLLLRPAEAEEMLSGHTFLFIGGPHRGGTTLLWRLLRLHPQAGAFDQRTDSDFSEGAFLQTVLPTFGVGHEAEHCRRPSGARRTRGVGAYAFDRGSHLTERSPLATRATRDTLLAEWGFYWKKASGLGRPLLVEKTPTNMMTARLLQALFAPKASFLFVTRHPIAVTLAERKLTACPGGRGGARNENGVAEGVLHWTLAHTVLERDLQQLESARVLRYEDLAASPAACLAQVGSWLGAPRADGGGVPPEPGSAAAWRRAVAAEEVSSSTNHKYEVAYCGRELATEAQRSAHCAMAAAMQPEIDLLGLGYNVLRGGSLGFECMGERVACAAEEGGSADTGRLRTALRESLAGYREPVAPDSAGLQLGGARLLCAGLAKG